MALAIGPERDRSFNLTLNTKGHTQLIADTDREKHILGSRENVLNDNTVINTFASVALCAARLALTWRIKRSFECDS